jgi:cellulose 1,4-beta-cellobiosidase
MRSVFLQNAKFLKEACMNKQRKRWGLAYGLALACMSLVFSLSGCEQATSGDFGGTKLIMGETSSSPGGTTTLRAPTGVTATAQSSTITVSWNPVSGADYYKIYGSESSSGPYSFVGESMSPNYYSAVSPNTTYYYKVSAVNSAGEEGPQSNYASVTPSSLPGGTMAPNTPTGVTATASGTSITVSWSSVSGAASYKVYRSDYAYGSYTEVVDSPTTGTTFTDTGLSAYTAYYYKVSAVNSAGESAQSSSVSATTSSSSSSNDNITYSSVSGGEWTLQSDGRRKSPTISPGGTTKAKISFTSSSGNGSITIQLDVSSEYNGDYAFISTLDNPAATAYSGYYTGGRISGTTSTTVTIPVSSPGSHAVYIGYSKDASVSQGSDCAWFTVIDYTD